MEATVTNNDSQDEETHNKTQQGEEETSPGLSNNTTDPKHTPNRDLDHKHTHKNSNEESTQQDERLKIHLNEAAQECKNNPPPTDTWEQRDNASDSSSGNTFEDLMSQPGSSTPTTPEALEDDKTPNHSAEQKSHKPCEPAHTNNEESEEMPNKTNAENPVTTS